MRNAAILFLLFFLSNFSKAQSLEWLNTVVGDSGYCYASDLTIDKENNTYSTGVFHSSAVNYNPSANIRISLIKYNESGQKCWHKNFEYDILAITADDDSCNIYTLVNLYKATKIGNDNYPAPKGPSSLVLIKADSAFNIEWTRLLSDSISFPNTIGSVGNIAKITARNKQLILYLAPNFTPQFIFKGKKYPTSTLNYNCGYWLKLEKTKQGNNNEWCSTAFGSSGFYGWSFHNLNTDDEGNIYELLKFAGTELYINDSLVTNNIKLKSGIIKFSPKDGSYKNVFIIGDSTSILRSLTVLPSGKMFVTGTFDYTFNYKTVSLSSPQPITGFIMFLDKNGNPLWAVKEDNVSTGGFTQLTQSSYRNGNLYTSGFLQGGSISWGGFLLDIKGNIGVFATLSKFDTLGNCLWAFLVNNPTLQFSSISAVGVDHNGNSITSGYFSNSITVLDTTVIMPPGTHAMIYKISDFAINRGDVYPGPYCAGDTFEIPYKLKGKFDTANTFIAQLSDEDGNFLGGERELGRLKANKDSVVKGVLPLLNVFTSAGYRIRILSTAPPAQSYYRQDTLRLLVYSRDSANAGNDTTICYGQKIRLKTTGGSKWEWSPAASLDNPNSYRPYASPITDTEYRIIISDSSGCGDIDTDYVWVRVRPPLNISAPFTDTTICRGQAVTLFANTAGGDSLHHTVQWYERTNGNDVFLGDGDKFITTSCGDSCANKPKTIIAVLTDNCTTLPDSQFYKISVLAPLAIDIGNQKNSTFSLKDTLLCQQQNIVLYTHAQGGNNKYTVTWHDENGVVATADSLALQPADSGNYYAVLTDNCTLKPDSALVKISLRPPLSIKLEATDSVCMGQATVLRITPSGGDSLHYQYTWAKGSNTFTQNPLTDYPASTTTYKAKLTDNCSPAATDSITVTVLPVPKADFSVSPKEGCPPLQVTFTDNSTGNDSNFNQWKVLSAEANGLSTFAHDFVKTGTYTFSLMVANKFGCTDKINKTEIITVFDKPLAQFTINPQIKEVERELSLYNYSQHATQYLWDMGDGNSFSRYNRDDVKYTYYDTGNFTVSLIAENGKGCKDTLTRQIRIFDYLYCIIPSAFTPNGDGINNTFSPVCTGTDKYHLTIFNRWGQALLDCENCAWDGTYAGAPAPEGVYLYQLKIIAQSRKEGTSFGTVQLIR
jgi:gliding motility-associated-like protein